MHPRLFVLALALGAAASAAAADRVSYTLDPVHTEVAVEVTLFGKLIQGGFDKRSGTLAAGGGTAAVDIQLETASVHTNTPAVDDQLRGPSFFDAEKHPKARLAINALPLQKSEEPVVAEISLRGRTGPVQLQGGGLACSPASEAQRENCRVHLEGTLQLHDFDMDSALPGTPKTAKLVVTVAAVRVTEPTAEPAAALVKPRTARKQRRKAK